jgi:hypothetical protein
MEKIEYRNVIDKSAWLRGPWDDEPDKVQWPDEATGLPCLIVRNQAGALCGYVGVPPDHPLHGDEYQKVESKFEVHGGLSFCGACEESSDPSHGICHIPGPGEPDNVWWFGFDCAHAFDLLPAKPYVGLRHKEIYRDLDYVRKECASLARQLAGK